RTWGVARILRPSSASLRPFPANETPTLPLSFDMTRHLSRAPFSSMTRSNVSGRSTHCPPASKRRPTKYCKYYIRSTLLPECRSLRISSFRAILSVGVDSVSARAWESPPDLRELAMSEHRGGLAVLPHRPPVWKAACDRHPPRTYSSPAT